MAIENITPALDLIIEWEGADVNKNPSEPGGISKYGVSLQTYADYCKKNNLPAPTMEDIANLTENDARTFYANTFLPAIRFNDLPSGVDMRMADIATNLGITGAINMLEMVLLQWPLKGQVTDDLLQTLNSYGAKMVTFALSAGYISNKHTREAWQQYGHGWSNRNIDVTNKTLGMIK